MQFWEAEVSRIDSIADSFYSLFYRQGVYS